MKEKDSIVDCPQQQVILYVEKDDGNYGPVQTGSYMTGNFLDDYELKRKHLEESLLKKIKDKEVSPVYYYMVLEDLSLSELSARARIRKGKVKKHLEYEGFQKIDKESLEKYADVFNASADQIMSLLTGSVQGKEESRPE